MLNNVLDKDNNDSIVASTEEDEPDKVSTLQKISKERDRRKNLLPYLSSNINKNISSLDDLKTLEISLLYRKRNCFIKKMMLIMSMMTSMINTQR